MKKNILLTGATGGIGSELAAQLLVEGHEVYMPVRSLETAQKLFSHFPNAHIEFRDLEDYEDVTEYCLLRAQEGLRFDFALLLVGDLRKDSNEMFAGETKSEKEKNSIIYHELVNVRTAETVVFGLKKAFGEKLNQTVLLGVSSWAANFGVDHPYRVDEEGYVLSKAHLSKLLKGWKLENFFKDVICEEPAMIRTRITEREFADQIADPNVEKLEPREYVAHLRKILSL